MGKGSNKRLWILFLIAAVFVATTLLSDRLALGLESFIGDHSVLGIFIYLAGLIFVTVLGPLTLLPILPIAVALWGPLTTALLNTVGWTIGGIIAFSLAQKYGQEIVERLVKLEHLRWIESRMPEKNLFLAVIVFRIVIPIDFVSYALGLFTNMRLSAYALATFIGTLPTTLFLAYAVTLPRAAQVLAVVVGIAVLVWGYVRYRRKRSRGDNR
jgi:uncharacterized membrane protein YdjX (TVP38/TMEM64 family)